MIISDLSHLEVVSEASSVVGGNGKHGKKHKVKNFKLPKTLIGNLNLTQQSNVAVVTQTANASSASIVTGKGDAISEANAVNVSTIEQANVSS